jgi:hypothetical protein
MGLLKCFVFLGGRILALNHISLEGFTFNMAVRMIQNSPDNIELIISQSKGTSQPAFRNSRASSVFRSALLSPSTEYKAHAGLLCRSLPDSGL